MLDREEKHAHLLQPQSSSELPEASPLLRPPEPQVLEEDSRGRAIQMAGAWGEGLGSGARIGDEFQAELPELRGAVKEVGRGGPGPAVEQEVGEENRPPSFGAGKPLTLEGPAILNSEPMAIDTDKLQGFRPPPVLLWGGCVAKEDQGEGDARGPLPYALLEVREGA
jgi:hypothetical protein